MQFFCIVIIIYVGSLFAAELHRNAASYTNLRQIAYISLDIRLVIFLSLRNMAILTHYLGKERQC